MNSSQVKQALGSHLNLNTKQRKKSKEKKNGHIVDVTWINICMDGTKLPLCFTLHPYEWGIFISLIGYYFLHFVRQCDVQMRIWKYNADLNTFDLLDWGLKRLDGNYGKYTFSLTFTAHCPIPGAH